MTIGMGQQIRSTAELEQVAIAEVMAGEKRLTRIRRERRFDRTTPRRWRQEDEERGGVAWAAPTPGAPSADERVAELERVIGQLTVEDRTERWRSRSTGDPAGRRSAPGRCTRP